MRQQRRTLESHHATSPFQPIFCRKRQSGYATPDLADWLLCFFERLFTAIGIAHGDARFPRLASPGGFGCGCNGACDWSDFTVYRHGFRCLWSEKHRVWFVAVSDAAHRSDSVGRKFRAAGCVAFPARLGGARHCGGDHCLYCRGVSLRRCRAHDDGIRWRHRDGRFLWALYYRARR